MAGRVRVDGQPATQAGLARQGRRRASRSSPGPAHVGRGALKLAGALDAFGVDPGGQGRHGRGRLDRRLHRDAARARRGPRLRGRRRPGPAPRDACARTRGWWSATARTRACSRAEVVPEPCALAVMDVSFISVRLILPALRTVLAPRRRGGRAGEAAVRGRAARRSAAAAWCKDAALHLQALRDVARGGRRPRLRRARRLRLADRRRRGQPRVLPAPRARRAGAAGGRAAWPSCERRSSHEHDRRLRARPASRRRARSSGSSATWLCARGVRVCLEANDGGAGGDRPRRRLH